MNRGTGYLLAGGAAAVGALLLGLLFGAADIGLGSVAAILGRGMGLPVEPFWKPWQETVVLSVRLPRTLLALAVGGGLAVAGAAMQGFFRNPLAEPGILGVSSGSALGGVVAIYSGLAAWSVWMLPFMSFVGGMGAIWTVYALTARRGRVDTGILLLAGVAIGVICVAATSFIISVSLANWQVASQILSWTMGGLSGRNWDHLRMMLPPALAGVAVILVFARDLDALVLGETQAWAVGVDVPRVRLYLIAATAAVTGATVAVAGPIGFVGLVVPHMLRLSLGPAHRYLLPAAALWGGAFLAMADIGCRLVMPPEELQLGILTAVIGGPVFIWLLIRKRRGLGI
ncbi:MAG: iron ABC transporter permease [Deltaproteobacteria bacterium]|nr:iron ABC transporter permease [Deltaproteobacteria bacterium]